MSKEQEDNSKEVSVSDQRQTRQAERNTDAAIITHADGTQEQVLVQSERMWSGTLPRPEDFSAYASIVEDAPERILRMAEKEQDHRIAMEQQIVPAGIKAGKRGQWLGAAISILALILATISGYLGLPVLLSTALIGVPVLSVAKSLVSAIRQKDDD